MRNRVGSLVLTAALALGGASVASAASACTGQTVVTGTLVQGQSLSGGANACSIGAYTFSNFYVTGVFILGGSTPFALTANTIGDNQLALGTSPNLSNGPTNPADDIQLSFEISPGIPGDVLIAGAGASVSEYICSTGVAGGSNINCGPIISSNSNWTSSNGVGSYSAVGGASIDYVFKDWSGGSEVTQVIVPEPMTFSLLGLGLLGVGLVGRRLRK